MNFPLYDSLIINTPSKDLTAKQKEDTIKRIENINDAGKELIYALIKTFYMKNIESESNSTDLPFKGIRSPVDGKKTENLTWDFANFPPKLRQLIHKFVILHEKTMEEEKEREVTLNS